MINTPAEVHNPTATALKMPYIDSPDSYRRFIAAAMDRKRQVGLPVIDYGGDDTTPIVAFISISQWVINCQCGAGNSVHPEWKMAGCYSCGRIHTNIIIPSDYIEIEKVLEERPPANRHFFPGRGETKDTLIAENIEKDVRKL